MRFIEFLQVSYIFISFRNSVFHIFLFNSNLIKLSTITMFNMLISSSSMKIISFGIKMWLVQFLEVWSDKLPKTEMGYFVVNYVRWIWNMFSYNFWSIEWYLSPVKIWKWSEHFYFSDPFCRYANLIVSDNWLVVRFNSMNCTDCFIMINMNYMTRWIVWLFNCALWSPIYGRMA